MRAGRRGTRYHVTDSVSGNALPLCHRWSAPEHRASRCRRWSPRRVGVGAVGDLHGAASVGVDDPEGLVRAVGLHAADVQLAELSRLRRRSVHAPLTSTGYAGTVIVPGDGGVARVAVSWAGFLLVAAGVLVFAVAAAHDYHLCDA